MDKWLWLFRWGLKGLIIRPKHADHFLHSSSTCESYAMILLRVLPEGLVKRLGCVLTGLLGVTSCSSFLRTLKIKCFSMKEKKVAGSWRHHGKCQSFHIISLTVLPSILYFPIAHNTLCLPPKFCINHCF